MAPTGSVSSFLPGYRREGGVGRMGSNRITMQSLKGSILRFCGTGQSADSLRWILFVIFYAVLVNIPYWVGSHELGFLHNGWFCIDYAAVGLIALFVPRNLSAALLLAVIAADLVAGVCQSYYLPVAECFTNMGVFHSLSGSRRHAVIAVVLLTLLVTSIAALLPAARVRDRHCRSAAACFIACVAILTMGDCFTCMRSTGHMPYSVSFGQTTRTVDGTGLRRFSDVRLVRIPLIRLIRMEREDATVRMWTRVSEASAPAAVPSATAQAMESTGLTTGKDLHELPNLVLVLVESWGLATDSSLNGALVKPYSQPELRDRYEVLQGTVPFNGPTVAGEARELCGSSFDFHLLNAASTELQGCLPARLAKLGYHDIAVHGMSGHMFSRSAWYGTIGFQEQWFNDRLKQQGLPDCLGAFIGTCDAAIAGWIGTRLDKEDTAPYFIHWMTLNSHLPVPVPAQLPTGAPCSRDLMLSPETPLCSWYQLVVNVHQSESQLAMGRLARPTVFVIVGDHAPPFADPALRDQFSSAVVPYVVLMPRAKYHPPGRMTAQSSLTPDRVVAKSSRPTPSTVRVRGGS